MAQKGLTPVTYERHGHRFWRRFTSYEFARHLTECSVVETEILQVAALFPIAFRKTSESCHPVALLSMQAGANTPFIAACGTWLARYVPTALRCPPFQAGRVPAGSDDTGQPFQLLVDETLGLVSDDPEDVRFFDETKGLTLDLIKVRSFLFQRARAEQETLALCRLIDELDLLSPLGRVLQTECPKGLFAVHLKAVRDLPANHRALLANSQALRLIHAHQVSLSHAAWLMQVQHQLANRSQAPSSSEVSGFLDAVVNSQIEDMPYSLDRQEGVHAHV